MAPKTGNNYISGTLTDSVGIPMPNSGFSMMSSSTEDYRNDCDNDRLPEIARLASKTSTLPFPAVVGRCRNRSGSVSSRWAWSQTPDLSMDCDPICHRSRDIIIAGFRGNIVIPGCRSLSQTLGDTLFGLAMVENPGLAVGISTLSVVVPVV